jgi:hypothetical protein
MSRTGQSVKSKVCYVQSLQSSNSILKCISLAIDPRSPPVHSPLSLDAIYHNNDVTPGILRLEEHHNRLGRCGHHEYRYREDRSRNNSNTTYDRTTLVGSPQSQSPLDKSYEHFPHPRYSSSSSSYSSISSHVGDSDARVSIR